MGGKVWSPEEERVYWHILIPQSQKRAGRSFLPTKSWEDLAMVMQVMMGAEAKRNYTGLGLFEHYFANVDKGRISPNAIKYVREHKEALERATQEEVETEVEDNDLEDEDKDDNATISDHSQRQAFSHTGETTEDEDPWDSDTCEDKENRPAPLTREPLAPLPLSPTYSPAPALDPVANLRISLNLPRRGLAYQLPTSSERGTLHTEATRDPPAYGFQLPPHEIHQERSPAMSHTRNTSISTPQSSVPAHFRGRPEDYQPGGRYFCLPTPDYRYMLPSQSQYNYVVTQPQPQPQPQPHTHYTPGHGMNFTVSREQYSPSAMVSVSDQSHTVSSPEVAFAPRSNSPRSQISQPDLPGTSPLFRDYSVENEHLALKPRGNSSQQQSSPSLKRSYEDFNEDGSAQGHRYNAPTTRKLPATHRGAPYASMNPNIHDSYPAASFIPPNTQTVRCGDQQQAVYPPPPSPLNMQICSVPRPESNTHGPYRPQFSYKGPIPKVIARVEPAHVQAQKMEDRRQYMGAVDEPEDMSAVRLEEEFKAFEVPTPAERGNSERPYGERDQ